MQSSMFVCGFSVNLAAALVVLDVLLALPHLPVLLLLPLLLLLLLLYHSPGTPS
jgi:hypothetical protein